MEIRNTSANDSNAKPERIDLTRKNREAIESRQPLTPKTDKLATPRDPSVQAKAVLAAREQHRAQHQERIANARLDYTARRNEKIADARDVYEARVAKAIDLRTARAAAHSQAAGSADKLEFSSESQKLARLDFASSSTDEARAQRVADLKQIFERRELNTSVLIARAAHRLLGGK